MTRRTLLAAPLLYAAQPTEWKPLEDEARRLGATRWRPMLTYLAGLHRRGTHPARKPFPHEWEEIGPGYHARAFGHWDIVHTIMDVLPTMREHAERQIRNNLANQSPEGLVPGVIWIETNWHKPGTLPSWNPKAGHPPLWPMAVDEHAQLFGGTALLGECYEPLTRQIGWFDANRRAEPDGYWYSRSNWESGIDDDLRQPMGDAQNPRRAFLDATCHVHYMLDAASRWAAKLGRSGEAARWKALANKLAGYVRDGLWCGSTFCDAWAVHDKGDRVGSFIVIFPLLSGIATEQQAATVIDREILNPKRLYALHPIRSVTPDTPGYEMLTWHGPAWNSMTFWAARACLRYGRNDAAKKLLGSALDQSAVQFARTGTIWEFYHPDGGEPESLRREVKPPYEQPRRDYTGHNPLFAMARLYEALAE